MTPNVRQRLEEIKYRAKLKAEDFVYGDDFSWLCDQLEKSLDEVERLTESYRQCGLINEHYLKQLKQHEKDKP